MLALITVTTPSAASRSVMPSSRASSPITRRAATSSSDMPPPRKLPRSSRPSTTLASVTVARVAAAAVGGRPRHGAGRARPDLEGAGLVDEGDRAAAGADRVHVDHRHQHGEARDPGVARGRLAEAALRHDADIGRGAADVEGDEVAPARQAARPVAADHAGRRAREQGEHRPLGHHAGRRDAAVRRHDAQVGLEARGARSPIRAASRSCAPWARRRRSSPSW